jgi:hypothetical protein
VVDALSDGISKTAGEVAAETGLARGTVSTTLSKLARGGEVVKAERGYRLPSRPGSAAGSASGEEAPSVDGPQSGERSRSDGDAASSPSS